MNENDEPENPERVSAADWRHWAEGFQAGWDEATQSDAQAREPVAASPMTAQCPEAVIADIGSEVGVVIQCGRDGGHDGNHSGIYDCGTAEWSRVEELRRPRDEPAPF